MECTLAALIACFNFSGIYIDGGLKFNDYDTLRPGWTDSVTLKTAGVIETISYQTAVAERGNPFGRLAVGYQLQFSRMQIALEVEHVLSLNTANDRGINSLGLKARWYPFR